MANSFDSVFETLLGRKVIDSHTRNVAGMCVKRFLKEMINSNSIDGIEDDDVEELAFDLVDELCAEEYTNNLIN